MENKEIFAKKPMLLAAWVSSDFKSARVPSSRAPDPCCKQQGRYFLFPT
jgi:hypothetical protein